MHGQWIFTSVSVRSQWLFVKPYRQMLFSQKYLPCLVLRPTLSGLQHHALYLTDRLGQCFWPTSTRQNPVRFGTCCLILFWYYQIWKMFLIIWSHLIAMLWLSISCLSRALLLVGKSSGRGGGGGFLRIWKPSLIRVILTQKLPCTLQ